MTDENMTPEEMARLMIIAAIDYRKAYRIEPDTVITFTIPRNDKIGRPAFEAAATNLIQNENAVVDWSEWE